jgi:hypothetical protein
MPRKLEGAAVRYCRHCREETHRLSRICHDCEHKRRYAWNHDGRLILDTEEFVHNAIRAMEYEDAQTVIQWFGHRRGISHEITDNRASVIERCKKYKITVAQWMIMVAKQRGCCAICDLTIHPLALFIDHDHVSGRVRGLLCAGCNFGLGHLCIDGPGALERAESVVRYIRKAPR